MSQIIPKVSPTDLAAVASLADENIITEDELSLVGSGAQGGFAFDGNNNYLSGTSDDFGTSDFTLVFDLLWDDAPSGVEYLARKDSGNNRWILRAEATLYRLQIINNGGVASNYIWSITPSVNHRNIVVSADRSGNATLYLNGASQGTRDISGDSSVDLGNGNTDPQQLGHDSGSFDGKMFQVRYYTEAKSSEQVANIAKGHNDTDNLFLKLAPTSTNESGWTDLSSNNRNFTANGATRIESNISKNYTSHSEYTAFQRKDGGYFLPSTSERINSDNFYIEGITDFSYIFAFNFETVGTNTTLFNQSGSAPNKIFGVFKTDGDFDISIRNTASSTFTGTIPSISNGVHVVAIVGDTNSAMTLYLDGVLIDTVDLTSFGTFNLASNSPYICIGGPATILSARAFNYALSDSDVKEYSRGAATKYADIVSSNDPTYTQDTSSGVDGWTVSNGTVDGNIDSIGGENDTLRLTVNGVSTSHALTQTGVFTVGKGYRLTGKVYISSANSHLDGIRIVNGSSSAVVLLDLQSQSTDTWIDFSTEFVASGTPTNPDRLLVYALDGSTSTVHDSGADDVLYLKNVQVLEIGETASYLPTSATENIWEDCSGLSNHAVNNNATLLTPSLQETYTTNQELVSSRAMNGPAYYFDGTNDYVEISDSDVWTYNDGTNDLPFTISCRLKPEDSMANTGFVSKYGSSTATEEWAFSTDGSGNTIFILRDSGGDYIQSNYPSLTLGDYVNLVLVYNGAGPSYSTALANAEDAVQLYINGKLIPKTSVNKSGTYDGMANTSQAVWVGRSFSSAYTFQGEIDRVQIFNRALTAAEVSQISKGQRPSYADIGADGTATYSSDYSSGTDGFIIQGTGSIDGNIDSIGGENDCLRLTADNTNGTHGLRRTLVFTKGKRYRLTWDYYIPSTNSDLTGFYFQDGATIHYRNANATQDSWTTVSLEFVPIGDDEIRFVSLNSSDSSNYADAGSDDHLFVKNVVATQLGEVLALLPSSAATGKWYNEGGAGSSGDGTVTGATLINERKRGVFDNLYLDNVPSSDAGLSTGEVYRDNNGHLKIVT